LKYSFSILLIFVLFLSCKNDKKANTIDTKSVSIIPEIVYEFGYNASDFHIIKDTIRKNETLGIILDRHHVAYPTINSIVQSVKDSFDLKKLKVGKPYTILSKKDTTQQAQVFIYQPNQVDYSIIDFKDSIITTKTVYFECL